MHQVVLAPGEAAERAPRVGGLTVASPVSSRSALSEAHLGATCPGLLFLERVVWGAEMTGLLSSRKVQ